MKEGSSYVVACEMEGRERRGAVTGLLFFTLMRTRKRGDFMDQIQAINIHILNVLFTSQI